MYSYIRRYQDIGWKKNEGHCGKPAVSDLLFFTKENRTQQNLYSKTWSYEKSRGLTRGRPGKVKIEEHQRGSSGAYPSTCVFVRDSVHVNLTIYENHVHQKSFRSEPSMFCCYGSAPGQAKGPWGVRFPARAIYPVAEWLTFPPKMVHISAYHEGKNRTPTQ